MLYKKILNNFTNYMEDNDYERGTDINEILNDFIDFTTTLNEDCMNYFLTDTDFFIKKWLELSINKMEHYKNIDNIDYMYIIVSIVIDYICFNELYDKMVKIIKDNLI